MGSRRRHRGASGGERAAESGAGAVCVVLRAEDGREMTPEQAQTQAWELVNEFVACAGLSDAQVKVASDFVPAIAAALLSAAGQWQTMESAPRDGTKVLAVCEANGLSYISVVWWRGEKFKDDLYQWRNSLSDSATGGFSPTMPNRGAYLWMPLPAPPDAQP